MAFLEWTKELDVGAEKFNAQHRDLITCMNRLYEAADAKKPKEALGTILNELGQLVVKHFKEEEEHMQEIGFNGIDTHKIIHQTLLTKFQEHVEAFENGPGELSQGFFDFLKMWLTSHIKGIDTKYGDPKNCKKVA